MQSRRTLLLVSIAIAVTISYLAGKIWLADARVHSGHLEVMESGAALEPGNADAWDRLGRLQQWDLTNPSAPEAIEDYKKAIQHDPLSAHYWMDLSSAYEASGDDVRAREALDRARAVYPTSAEVAWNYGNFLLRHEQYSEGFALIRQGVQADPSLLPVAISRTWRASGDVNQLLNEVVPANADAYFQALDFFVSRHDAGTGLVVWQRLLELGKPIPLPRAYPFLDELISEDRSEDTQRVWREALGAAGLQNTEPVNRSLIWNGNFSKDFLNGGLDWRWSSLPGVVSDFESAPPGHVGRAFRLDFSGGANLDLGQPAEFVPVEPARTYQFQASMRTDGITTESGICFSIVDPHHNGAVSVTTENWTGSRAWGTVQASITTGSETHFLMVRLRRAPSRLFDNRLSGATWIADISLVPSSAATGQPSP